MKQKYRYELRQVEAWADPECGWTWNCSWHMMNLSTSADDLRGVLRRALKKQGITVLRPKYDWDGSVMTVCDRENDEPLFALIPLDY